MMSGQRYFLQKGSLFRLHQGIDTSFPGKDIQITCQVFTGGGNTQARGPKTSCPPLWLLNGCSTSLMITSLCGAATPGRPLPQRLGFCCGVLHDSMKSKFPAPTMECSPCGPHLVRYELKPLVTFLLDFCYTYQGIGSQKTEVGPTLVIIDVTQRKI